MFSKLVGHHIQLEFNKRDVWIGLYWKQIGNCIDVWICLLPMLPLHISWWWSEEGEIEREMHQQHEAAVDAAIADATQEES